MSWAHRSHRPPLHTHSHTHQIHTHSHTCQTTHSHTHQTTHTPSHACLSSQHLCASARRPALVRVLTKPLTPCTPSVPAVLQQRHRPVSGTSHQLQGQGPGPPGRAAGAAAAGSPHGRSPHSHTAMCEQLHLRKRRGTLRPSAVDTGVPQAALQPEAEQPAQGSLVQSGHLLLASLTLWLSSP